MSPKEIRIDGVIGCGKDEISAAWVRTQLPSNGTDPIRVSLHSEGGSVFEGFAIHDAFAEYTGPKSIAVESTAFSISSFIPMAFDDIEISPNGYFMLHNPRIKAEGDDEELSKNAGMLSSLKTNMINAYATRTGKTPDEIKGILKDETYFNATQAVEFGLANRITEKPVRGRVIAQLASMPHGIVTALYGAGSSGDNDSAKGKPMTESTPVAATVQQIRAAYPKAKAEFVLSCIEKSLPMASVASAAAEEMMKENEDLKAQVKAMSDELTALKTSATAKAEACEDEPDEKVEAKAKATGAKPVAKSTAGRPSARVQWDNAISAALPLCGNNKMKAAALANRDNPGLREQMLTEVNAR